MFFRRMGWSKPLTYNVTSSLSRRVGRGVWGVRTSPLWNPYEVNEPPLKQTNPPSPLEKTLFSLFDYLHRWAHGGLGGRTPYFLKKNVFSSKKRTPSGKPQLRACYLLSQGFEEHFPWIINMRQLGSIWLHGRNRFKWTKDIIYS